MTETELRERVRISPLFPDGARSSILDREWTPEMITRIENFFIRFSDKETQVAKFLIENMGPVMTATIHWVEQLDHEQNDLPELSRIEQILSNI